MLCCCAKSESNKKYAELDAKLERKMVESRRSYPGHRSLKSLDSIIMKFPKLREGLRNIRSVFESYGNVFLISFKIPPFLEFFFFRHLFLRIRRWRWKRNNRHGRAEEMLRGTKAEFVGGRSERYIRMV